MTKTFSRGFVPIVATLSATLSIASLAAAADRKPTDPDRKICRSEVPTGSMMRRSVCHTAAQWAQIEGANAASAQEMRDRQRTGATQ